MMIKTSARLAAVLGGITMMAGVGVAQAPAANAWDGNTHVNRCGILRTENCGHGGVGDNNRRVFAYDQRSDDAGFRTNYRMINGVVDFIKDPDGNGGGSGQVWTPEIVSAYQVCSEQPGGPAFWFCSGWISVL
ncbi:hypothetical protein ACIQ9P_09855 [Kitasatospora sp. NPDC094019]|uniref:hypothetical protein n=1 Tax=Kitasatospora sp. NPDC094019 TaxID=3364091 RepID=UPI00381403B5